MEYNIISKEEIENEKNFVNSIFNTKKSLPEFIFHRKYKFYLFHQYSNAFLDLLDIIQRFFPLMAQDTILRYILEPEAYDDLYAKFGQIGAYKIKASISRDAFREITYLGDMISGFINREVYISLSGTWALWDDYITEMAVLGLDDAELVSYVIDNSGYWVDAETALADFGQQAFRNQIVPESFSCSLIANYGSLADLEAKLGRKVVYPEPSDP